MLASLQRREARKAEIVGRKAKRAASQVGRGHRCSKCGELKRGHICQKAGLGLAAAVLVQAIAPAGTAADGLLQLAGGVEEEEEEAQEAQEEGGQVVAEQQQQQQQEQEAEKAAANCGVCRCCRSMKKFGGDGSLRRTCERREPTDLQLLAKKRKSEKASQRYAEGRIRRAHPKRFGMKRPKRKKLNGNIDKRLGEGVVSGGTSGDGEASVAEWPK